MGISINTDLSLLYRMFNVSPHKIDDEYSGMSIEEIMKAEAEAGNPKAADFDSEVLNNPVKLIELFQLNNVGNKFELLSNMSEQDLNQILPLLEQSDMIAGLQFFDKEKLLSLAEKMPKDQLINLTLEMFSPEQLMQFLPEQQLNKILTSTDLDKQTEMKALASLNPQILAQIYEAAMGQPMQSMQAGSEGKSGSVGSSSQALLSQIQALPDDKFQEAMLNMPPVAKRLFCLSMTKENPELLKSVDSSAYTNVIGQRKDKSDIIRSSNVIEPEQLVKMLEQLPKDLTAVVLTQIDTKQFADLLQANFKDILSQIMAG